MNYIYFYNGGGVGVGDINNDGLDDLFFAGNLVNSRLYLNKGNFEFIDITGKAGINDSGWSTGVSMVDINGDGYLDIYVGQAGYSQPEDRKNLLYLNNGDLTFTESAQEFGIADPGYTTHSAFFDYDLDGDLDLYVLNHGNDRSSLNTPKRKELKGQNPNTDVLYQNNGDHTFSNVSIEAGISIEGYGLGLAVSDLNHDGLPDLYIANDFIGNDILYINQGDGTFRNLINEKITEQSYNGMGVDINDINNDAMPDIMVLDMLPPDPVRRKTMAGSMTYDKFATILQMDYQSQFVRNTLHLSEGNSFREIGRFAGVHSTDWSWAPLFFDADRDGWKDLFITNGYLKDITDKDFMDYENNLNMFKEGKEGSQLDRIEVLNGVKLSNYLFANNKDNTFSDQSTAWGVDIPSYSNGASYADLDQDGDLDLVVNNINAPAFILENKVSKDHYIQFDLRGVKGNPSAIGSQILVYCGSDVFQNDVNPYRGFMSSVSDQVFLGLGDHSKMDSVLITWPDGMISSFYELPADTLIYLDYSATDKKESGPEINTEDSIGHVFQIPGLEIDYRMGFRNSFKKQPLYPINTINNLPVMVVGDLNGDGKDDLVIDHNLFIQGDGEFSKITLEALENRQINDLLVSDFNGDGINDLFVACGMEGYGEDDVIYFTETNDYDIGFPGGEYCTRTVSNLDIDQDGDQDIFLGTDQGAVLLINEEGSFHENQDPDMGLSRLKWITDSEPEDINGDGWIDLVITSEWGSVTVLLNEKGKLRIEKILSDHKGLWQSVLVTDLNDDGLPDILAGNVGLNGPIKASQQEPLAVVMADPDSNGIQDVMVTHYINGKNDLFITRELLFSRFPFYSRRYRTHRSFASASIEELLEVEELESGHKREVNQLSSMYWLNRGDLEFEAYSLSDPFQYFAIADFIEIPGSSTLILAQADQQYRFFDGATFGAGNGRLFSTKDSELRKYSAQFDASFSLVRKVIKIEGYGLCMFFLNNEGIIKLKKLKIGM